MRRRDKVLNAGWKRSKHSIGKRASIKSLKRYCKEVWAEFVKERDGHKCVLCQETKYLNSHHVITSKCSHTRYETDVGITLCAKHHKLGVISAHGTPWIVYEWIEKNRPEQWKWFLENKDKVYLEPVDGTLEYYQSVLKSLLDKFEKYYPAVLKRSKYFKFTEEEEKVIIDFYTSDKKESLMSTASHFDCGEMTIRGIMKRNGIPIRRNPSKHNIEVK
jgi:hypothetical protein